ncbi:MAG: hypothetical protein LBE81_08430 [Azonexus sp.]|jgi:hypothetical protein|uniref:hypothetical protein n=1 Tax=Azonexus sp. TaxID=1872668 RepID=UPI0028282E23|nr:hypothetical protein [Azonexus sp.]MDR0776648.1 hypothetical protein [Azonexus sp.]
MLELLLTLAIVTQDQIPLRGAPEENAPRHAVLTQGDTLEVRGVKGDYLQVYDHRRERAGYILATQAAEYQLDAKTAPKLLAVAEFLADQPGSEALGIAYSAAFLKATPAEMIDANAFAALGRMADRLAWRASRVTPGNEKAAQLVSAHMETAANTGVAFYSVERNDKMTLCYDGDAWRHVMALPASPEQKVEAALSLTRHECVKADLLPSQRLEADLQRAATLGRVLDDGAKGGDLPEHLKNRLKIRAAGVWAGIAHEQSMKDGSDAAAVIKAGQTAQTLLAGIDKNALTASDRAAWNVAAIRVGASRWAAQPQTLAQPGKGRPGIALAAGDKPGQTCVKVIAAEGGKTAPDAAAHCTFGHIWTASLAVSPDGKFMTLAVQPLNTWRELWVFRQEPDGWQLDIVPPATDNPELGYIEFAGWVPGNKQMLVARETVAGCQAKTSFELWNRSTLSIERRADKPGNLSTFYRWQDPAWKGGTVAVR